MLIYTPVLTSRLQFIMGVFFHDILQVNYRITTDSRDFQSYSGIKWCYGVDFFPDTISFQAHSLLFEKNIYSQNLDPIEWKNFSLFFAVNENPYFPFDPFAVAFYLVSRYEEYLPHEKDEHNRFDIKNAISFQRNFHRVPLVNILALEVALIVKSKYPDFQWNKPPVHFLYTCDIDITFKYKGKGVWRWCGGVLKSLFQGKFSDTTNYFKAVFQSNFQDPYEISFDNLKKKTEDGKSIIHFIPTGNLTKYDRNICFNSSHLKKIIQQLLPISAIGLHPSYYSYRDNHLILKEKKRLEKICETNITKSRQHYLRLHFPDTYEILSDHGILDDYSLGWSNEVGFRASISTPFNFFNLKTNRETNLKIHSLLVMDVALSRITKNQHEIDEIIKSLYEVIEKWGGEYIILQHNSSPIIFS